VHEICKLQPAWNASSVSIWSKNPMPVAISMDPGDNCRLTLTSVSAVVLFIVAISRSLIDAP